MGSASSSGTGSVDRVTHIAARPVGVADAECEILDVREIAFFFLGMAAARGFVDLRGPAVRLAPTAVYIRTAAGGLYQLVSRKRLVWLQHRLATQDFVRVKPSLLVNGKRIKHVEFRAKLKRVGFRIGSAIEWVSISRAAALELACRFHMRDRHRGVTGGREPRASVPDSSSPPRYPDTPPPEPPAPSAIRRKRPASRKQRPGS